MDPCELAAFITATAVFISKNVPDDDELGVIGSAFAQLGDTITTISLQRALLAEKTQAASKQSDQEDNA